MKRKIMLPLFAIVFAIAGALATSLPSQTAWFKPITGAVTQGTISTPSPSSGITCSLSGANICKVSNRNAYDTEAHAQAQGEDGLYRYNE